MKVTKVVEDEEWSKVRMESSQKSKGGEDGEGGQG